MSPQEHQHIINKQHRLPDQLSRARKRVRRLELECRRYGMTELLEVGEHG